MSLQPIVLNDKSILEMSKGRLIFKLSVAVAPDMCKDFTLISWASKRLTGLKCGSVIAPVGAASNLPKVGTKYVTAGETLPQGYKCWWEN